MPCGGISPMGGGAGTIKDKIPCTEGGCWVCERGGCRHFFFEFDTYIHAACALDEDFLFNNEGRMIMEHKHTMTLDFSLEEDNLGVEKIIGMIDKMSAEERIELYKALKDL